jgi:hypothetical protein
MSKWDEIFEGLFKRPPTDEERQDLYRIFEAGGIKHGDAFVFVVMQDRYRQSKFKDILRQVEHALNEFGHRAQDLFVDFRATANLETNAAKERLKADLADAVVEVVSSGIDKAVQRTSTKQLVQWLSGLVIALLLSHSVLGWYTHRVGYRKGESEGEKVGRDAGFEEGRKKGLEEGLNQRRR